MSCFTFWGLWCLCHVLIPGLVMTPFGHIMFLWGLFSGSVLDHNDPSKPSHRLTNGPKPSKTIESDGSNIKNHRKTIDGNGQTAQKHSMVMVSSKTIENLQWSLHFSGPPLCRPLCICRRCFAKNSWGYLKVLSYFSQLFEISWYDIIIIWWYDLDQGLHH